MVAVALQAGYAGTWAGSLNGPSRVVGRPSQCSNWVARLAPLPRKTGLKPVSLFLAGGKRSVLDFPSARRFGCDRLTRKAYADAGRVFASGGADEPISEFGSIPIDPSVFEGDTYQLAKDAYHQKEGPEAFKGCEELFPVYESQHVLGNGKINTADGPILVDPKEESPVELWDVVKKAPGIIAAAVITGILLFSNSGPAKAPTMREPAAYRSPVRTSDRAAAPRRGRNTARKAAQQQDESIPLILPGAILACVAFAMVLLRNKTSRPEAFPEKKKPVKAAVKEDPYVTVFRLNFGVLGTATSLRMDLEELGSKPMDGRPVHPKSLKATARVLMKNLEHIAFARKRMRHAKNMQQGRTYFNNYEVDDTKHVHHVPTADMLKSIRKGYGHKVAIDAEEKPFVDYLKTGYTVVTLTCALKGQVQFPKVKDTLDLHFWLARLERFDPKDIVNVTLNWGPTEGETMPEEIMHKHFPELELLAREEDIAEIEKVSA